MTVASLVMGVALLGQLRSTEPTTPAPRFTPRSAPAARISEDDSRSSATPRTRSIYSDDEPADTRSTRSSRTTLPEDDGIRTFGSGTSRTATRTADEDERLAPVGSVNQKMGPPEIMAEALSEVPEGAFLPVEEGDPLLFQKLRLVDAIKRASDRTQQIKIAQIYWRLAIAQADYHFARDAVNQLREATRGQLSQPALRAARCAMRALQRDAETLVIRAQNALAVEMSLPSNSLMPLAIDIPHTGAYDTRISLVYSGRTPPPRAILIDRMIPVRRKSIEEHSLAIIESLDAVDASADEYAKGTADLTTLILAFERLWKERKAFTGAVREYNQDIAEYALTAAPGTSDPNALVAMLIKSGASSTRTTTPATVIPRSATPRYSEPLDDEAAPPLRSNSSGDRYRAAPEEQDPPSPTRIRNDATSDPFRRGTRLSRPVPTDSFASFQRDTANPDATLHSVNYQAVAPRNIDFDDVDAQRALWRALVDVDTPLRTQRLAAALNAPEMLPRDSGQLVSLADCLSACQPSARRDVIAAYWAAREAAATYQVLSDEASELASLSQAATRIRNARGGPEAAIRLQALRRTVKAALLDAQVELLLSQYDLTTLCGGRLQDDWYLPNSSPHGGRYLLRIEDQPPELVEAKMLDQLGAIVKVLHEQMEDHAGTVVYADSARATALRDPGAGPEIFDMAMALIERQAIHTVFFLRATTRYNLAIADYVLAIMPENVPAEKLVSALVLTRNRTARG